ncbi:MAG: hypothetical protein V4510_13070 [bacterium]
MTSIEDILEYEDGSMDPEDVLRFFAGLVKSGEAWTLQGHYGRTAHALITQGYITPEGEVL